MFNKIVNETMYNHTVLDLITQIHSMCFKMYSSFRAARTLLPADTTPLMPICMESARSVDQITSSVY